MKSYRAQKLCSASVAHDPLHPSPPTSQTRGRLIPHEMLFGLIWYRHTTLSTWRADSSYFWCVHVCLFVATTDPCLCVMQLVVLLFEKAHVCVCVHFAVGSRILVLDLPMNGNVSVRLGLLKLVAARSQ